MRKTRNAQQRRPRGARQPRQGILVNKTNPPLPRSLAINSAQMTIPVTMVTGAATLATSQVGYTQLSAVARWANISSYFVDVHFIDVTVLPLSLSAAASIELAFLRKHLPYNPTTADSASAAPYSTASLCLLPGYQRWQQGNGDIVGRTYKLDFQMRVATFTTDMPVLFELLTFATVATNLLLFVRVSFTDIVSGI